MYIDLQTINFLVLQHLNYYLKHLTTNFYECSFCCHFIFTCYSFCFFGCCYLFLFCLVFVCSLFHYCTEFVITGRFDIFILITYVYYHYKHGCVFSPLFLYLWLIEKAMCILNKRSLKQCKRTVSKFMDELKIFQLYQTSITFSFMFTHSKSNNHQSGNCKLYRCSIKQHCLKTGPRPGPWTREKKDPLKK